MINLYDPMKATQMCLVSNVVILNKFKVLEFIKKNIGIQCAMNHL